MHSLLRPAAIHSIAISAAACGLALIHLTTSVRGQVTQSDRSGPGNAFEFKQVSDTSLALSENGKPVFVYNHGDIRHELRQNTHPHSNYFHPIYGLDGEVLTDDFPADHYHHRGLYWGWPTVQVGDRQVDSWHYRNFSYKFHRWLGKETTPNHARLGVENGWYAGDKQVVKEVAWVEVHPATDDGRNIDLALTWTPLDEPVSLQGADGKSYGGLNLRFAPRTDTMITVPTGRTSEDLLITRLPWADLSARIQGAQNPSGAAVFVHPSHPDFPPEWMTREYGLLSVGWPGVNAKTLAAGEPVTCRYRIWLHRGTPDAATIQKAYDEYRTVE
jgi:hypothetical protein